MRVMRQKLLLSTAMMFVAVATASAADLKPYTKAPPPPPPVFSWNGFYIGVSAGGKWANIDQDISSGATAFSFTGNNSSSWLAGGQLGYNWQAPGSSWVFGIEGDVHAQDFDRTRVVGVAIGPFIPGDSFRVESDWQASIRGRIGYSWDRLLIYATGGVAFAQRKVTVNLVGLATATNDDTLTGGTVGGGLEYAIWNNVSIGVEGRWSFYGDQTITGTIGGIPVTDKISLDTAEVLGKLNFRF